MSDFDPRYGEGVALAPGLVRVTAPNSGPFTGAGTNTYVLGHDRLMVVDPGPDDARHHDTLRAVLAGRPVSHILITHTHRDHVAGLAAFQAATGAATVAEGPHREARPLADGEVNPFRDAADYAFVPDHSVADGEAVDNGEVAVTAVATPGHTANHLAFAFGSDLFSGDHVMGWSTTVIAPPDGAMGPYLRSLDRLLARDDARYLPGHGDVIEAPRQTVQGMRSHRLMRERAIMERVAAGAETIVSVVDALYAGLDTRLKRAAGLTVLAHLEKLRDDGHLALEGFGQDVRIVRP